MSEQEMPSSDEVLNRIFGLSMAGVIGFIAVVFIFIL